MVTAVAEYCEVYKQEAGNEQELRWFLCHAKRLLEQATNEKKEAEILFGTCSYTPHNFEELQEVWRKIVRKAEPYFREGKKVFCRVIFKTP